MKHREHWLDVVKGITIILVVVGHVIGIYELDTMALPFMAIRTFIYSFHMPLFMFISGILFSSSLSKDYRTTAISKLLTYGIPYIVFSAVYWLMKVIGSAVVNNTVAFKDLILIPVFPLSFMWYLYALLFMTELSLLIGRKNKTTILVVSIVCRIVWEILFSIDGFARSWVNDLIITDFIKNYIWFGLGLEFANTILSALSQFRNSARWCTSICLLGILIIVSPSEFVGLPFLRFIWGGVGITATISLGLIINKNSFLEYLGRNTMPIYLIHGTVISVLKIITTKLKISGGVHSASLRNSNWDCRAIADLYCLQEYTFS